MRQQRFAERRQQKRDLMPTPGSATPRRPRRRACRAIVRRVAEWVLPRR
jgi:hypothetical protein